MTFIATAVFAFLIIGTVVYVLSRVGTPRYRLTRDNVITLLKGVLQGRATPSDWHVFVGIPIRYDPELEAVRQRCMAIEEREFRGHSRTAESERRLFTPEGLRQIGEILGELENGTARPADRS